MTKAETEALDPETIERMDVFKDRTQLDSLNIDSEKNITGVVKITLKKE